ncbi:hypothetical protein FOCG_17855 [Fusarium oxysporum f. sp. radicis-lycopersici 26381]|nr:hypothetical protein FOCG_17855 [Fusarium oxysporum f. sp. radicis-lycopersici 26381]
MSRAIDRLPTPACVREKKVIIVARSRTGTLSLYKALTLLGYRTYHGAEVMARGVSHLEIFTEALNAKYFGVGKPYGRAEFDKWLADYDAIVEIPAVFLEEFVEAYPEVPFIHVERDPHKWYISVMNTMGHSLRDVDKFPLKQLRYFDTFVDRFCEFHLMVQRVWWHGKAIDDGEDVLKSDYNELQVLNPRFILDRCAKRCWITRNRRVKELVPQHKLASFNLEDGFGWEQLCPALGVPIPDVPYPKANIPVRFDKMQAGFVRNAMRKAYAAIGTTILVPSIAVAAWYYIRR